MKKIILLFSLFALNSYFSQTNNVLKLKFNERYFLSNFITHKTNNSFVLKVFKKTDSISDVYKNKDYVLILDSILKGQSNLSEVEKMSLTDSQKKEFDSLKIEIDNGDFLKLMKNVIQVNFDSKFIEDLFEKNGVKNNNIEQPDFNKFSINFSNEEDLKKAKVLFSTNELAFHESIADNDLEKIQTCFMKENDNLVKNNYLKKEEKYFLIYNDDTNLSGQAYKKSKCFDSKKITFLLKNGIDSDVFSKLYFVKESSEAEIMRVNSIRGFDISFKQNKDSYTDNLFYLSIYLDGSGKRYLSKISENNIAKTIFMGSGSKFISSMNVKEKMTQGIFISGNLFKENWQELYGLVKFEVFKNSLTIQ